MKKTCKFVLGVLRSEKFIAALLFCFFLWTFPIHSSAKEINVFQTHRRIRDVNNPKTNRDVVYSYRSVINWKDGISLIEARIISQYQILKEHLELNFDISKPKLISESSDQWQIRFPPFYSFNHWDRSKKLIVCVDKERGEVLCFKEDRNEQP